MQPANDVFSGTWQLNPGDSNFDPTHRPTAATLRFEAIDGGYLMFAEGVCDGKAVKERPQRLILDGAARPVPDAPGITATALLDDGRTIRVEARNGDEIVGSGSYAVSPDGTQLIATMSGTDAQLRPFQTVVAWTRA